MRQWVLPRQAEFDGCVYTLNADFRDVLEIMEYLQDPALPEFIRWHIDFDSIMRNFECGGMSILELGDYSGTYLMINY